MVDVRVPVHPGSGSTIGLADRRGPRMARRRCGSWREKVVNRGRDWWWRGAFERRAAAMRAIVMRRIGGRGVSRGRAGAAPNPGRCAVDLHARGGTSRRHGKKARQYGPTPLQWILGGGARGVSSRPGRRWAGAGWPAVAFHAPPGWHIRIGTGDLCGRRALYRFPMRSTSSRPRRSARGLTAYHRSTAPRVRAGRCGAAIHAAAGCRHDPMQLAPYQRAVVLRRCRRPTKRGRPGRAGGEPVPRSSGCACSPPARVDVVLDSVGLPTQSASLSVLAQFGELVHFGDTDGLITGRHRVSMGARSGSGVRARPEPHPAATAEARRDLVAWATDGTALPHRQLRSRRRPSYGVDESRATIGRSC
jgi:hypothetical protein